MEHLAVSSWYTETVPLLLFVVLIFGVAERPGIAQEDETPEKLRDVINTLSGTTVPSFQSNLRPPFSTLQEDRDETVQSLFTYDGDSRFHSTWFRLFYNRAETLVMRNHERMVTPELNRVHRWWIRGTSSAFVDRGQGSFAEMLDNSGGNRTERIQTLVSILYQVQLFPGRLKGMPAKISTTDSGVRIRIRTKRAQDGHWVLKIRLNRSENRIVRVQITEQLPASYFNPDERTCSLQVSSFHNSGVLPRRATYQGYDNEKHPLSFSYGLPGNQNEFKPDPGWFHPDRRTAGSASTACGNDPFQIARKASFFNHRQFQKRLAVHSPQLDRINSCYDQLKEHGQLGVPERELRQAIRFSEDPSYTPSWPSSETLQPTAFFVLLRMVRLVKRNALTSKNTGSVSLPPIYSPAIQVLAFRSSLRSIKKPGAFTRQLNRITKQYEFRTGRLFVRELEMRLRGTGDQKGLIQQEGKSYLANMQKKTEPSIPSNLLMARLYHHLGYFQKADKSYASLVDREDILPEIKRFIRSARTKATNCLKALPIDVLEPKEILYSAGLNARNGDVQSLRHTVDSFLNAYRETRSTSLYLEDIYILRESLQLLIQNDHVDLVRSVLEELIRRENGRYVRRSYMRPIIQAAYGSKPSEQYELVRFLRNTDRVSSFLSLASAVEEAGSRIKNENAERVDYTFLARAIPVLLKENTEQVTTWRTHLQNGRRKYASSHLIIERLADLYLESGRRKKAADTYHEAIKARIRWITNEDATRVIQDVPGYASTDRFLDRDHPEPRIDQPVPIKYALASAQTDRTGRAKKQLKELFDQAGRPENWENLVRDPGVAANYEQQYAAWGQYILNEPDTAVRMLRTSAKREHGQYPFGAFQDSATDGLSKMLIQNNNISAALKLLRRSADQELEQPQIFRYRGNAGEAYVRLASEQDRPSKVMEFLKRAARTEWLRMTSFSYSDSATEQLVNVLFNRNYVDDALRTLKRAFYRSLEEKPSFTQGTAPYEFVRNLKKFRHTVDALVVAREFSKIYPSDPEPLRSEIISLEKKMDGASIVTYFVDRFSQEPTKEVERTVNEALEKLDENSQLTQQDLIDRLSQAGHGVISVLNQARKTASSDSSKEQYTELIRSLGWRFVRLKYERPDLLDRNFLDES